MKCLHCSNEARYVDTEGSVRCGIHDARMPTTSIKINDVPRMIALVDELLYCDNVDQSMAELRTLIFKQRQS